MLPMHVERAFAREKILGDHVRAVAADLRLIELSDLVAYLRTAQFASVGTLVQSSIEMSFKPDTLFFGYSGDVELEWGGPMRLALDMEFHHLAVHVYFRLLLDAHEAGVEILCMSFNENTNSPEANTLQLGHALADARVDAMPR